MKCLRFLSLYQAIQESFGCWLVVVKCNRAVCLAFHMFSPCRRGFPWCSLVSADHINALSHRNQSSSFTTDLKIQTKVPFLLLLLLLFVPGTSKTLCIWNSSISTPWIPIPDVRIWIFKEETDLSVTLSASLAKSTLGSLTRLLSQMH